MNINVKPIYDQTEKDTHVSLTEKALKAQEELGELAAEILAYNECQNKSASAKGSPEAILEESVDTIICVVDILAKMKFSTCAINVMIEKKAAKWAAKSKQE